MKDANDAPKHGSVYERVAWAMGYNQCLKDQEYMDTNAHLQAKVSVAADRIDELEATIRKMAMDSLSVEGQWSDKVDDLKVRVIYLTRTLQYERENPVFEGKCDTWQAACGIARGKVVELEEQLEAKQARIDELEKRQVTEIANQMLNGWEEDQE